MTPIDPPSQGLTHLHHVARRGEPHVLVLNPGAKASFLHEKPKALGRDGETVWSRNPRRVSDLPEIGHLATHNIGMAGKALREIQDPFDLGR